MTPAAKALWLLTGGALLAGSLAVSLQPRWVWNATASAPEGLYRLHSHRSWTRGDLVAVRPSPTLGSWLDRRGYAPAGVLLIKRVAALAPSEVCRDGGAITIDRTLVAHAEARDRRGRTLPVWRGCRVLGAGEVFLLNPAQGSLDSRYLGVLPRSSVVGRVTPLWLISDRPDAH